MATKKWANLRPEIVADLGSDVLAEARRRTENYVDAHRLADRRKNPRRHPDPGDLQ